ncbi:MAG: aminoglycoside/choline kinase family phosphotransferase [Verrucomicrobiales bacterium]|jgi:aminoglycoside/choline kinase family phosphotransferase
MSAPPAPDSTSILDATRQQLPGFPIDDAAIEPLLKGGSGRFYFRVRSADGEESLIFSQFSNERPENARFAAQSDFLRDNGVAAPRILARDLDLNRLWIEDLGETDLWSFRDTDWGSTKRPLYETTLVEVDKIHALRESTLENPPIVELPFDEELYRWEQGYFLDHFAKNFSAASEEEIERIRLSAELTELAQNLAAKPRCLVHRDFQSQNVMIRAGAPAFIDYQGLRFGLAEYDLASLIFDPYVSMATEQREELISFAESRSDNPEFSQQLLACACQRLMQALGAYGFLGLAKAKPAFLEHIEPAIANLRYVALEQGALTAIEPLLKLRA